MGKDTIFSTPVSDSKVFTFDKEVANVFDDMIVRSVPMYHEIQGATTRLIVKLCKPDTNIYDLGCSTGNTLISLADEILDPSTKIIGIDNSPDMLEICKSKLIRLRALDRVELQEADILTFTPNNASAIILNYTLQFAPPEQRLVILKRCYQGLIPNGTLILSEKVIHQEPKLQSLFTDLYYDFKRRNGYSELEISQKRTALENVMVPLSTEENIALLKQAGFSRVELYLKWHCFSTFVAIKD
jgi:tRNA (cmo5U34)-methyltransferase